MMISDISNGGVRRSRDNTDDVTTSGGDNKRRKHDFLDNNEGIHLDNSLETTVRSQDSGNTDLELLSSGSNEDRDLGVENEASNSSKDCFSRETSASSEICCLDSEGIMHTSSSLKKKKKKKKKKPLAPRAPRKLVTVMSSTMAAEIDEFFAVAEKKEQKRFADKYNYDIVNDLPMEGKYEWIRLKP